MNFFTKLFQGKTEKKSYNYQQGTVINSRDLINNLFKFRGGAGDNQLIEEGFISNPDLYSIITSLCEIGSDIPFLVEQKTGEGWEIDLDSTLNKLISTPNETLSEKDFRYNTLNYLLNTGDIFWRKTTSAFDLVTETNLLESNLVDFLYNTNGEVKTIQYSKNNTIQIDYLPEDIIHNLYINPSIAGIQSKRGLSPLQAGYAAMISSNNRGVASASMLENGGAANLISSGSELSMAPQEMEDVQKAFQKRIGGANKFGKNITTTANLKVNSLGMSSQQMQMLEGTVIDRRILCNIFRVDSSLFNDKESSTFNNIQSVSKAVYTRAIVPNNQKIISGYNSIIPAYNSFENKELRIVQDLSNIEALQEDQKEKADKDQVVTDTLTGALSSPISNEQKIQVLVHGMGMEEEKAKLIVGKEIVDNETV